MDKNDWEQRYIIHLIEKYGFDRVFAQEAFDAGIDDYDYDDSPEFSADEEMSYWGD